MRSKKRKKIIVLIFTFICFNIMIFSVGKLISWQIDNNKTKKTINKANTIVEETKSISIPKLKKINKDSVGWVQVKGTKINYPVVQAKNNSYYLTHDYNKEYNSAGWIFMDFRNNPTNFDKNTIIYGHSRLDKTMFGSLKNILQSNWYKNKDNYYIKYYTNDTKQIWEVFSIYTIPTTDDYIQVQFKDNKEYTKFLNKIQKRSNYKFDVYLSSTDNIITLSTCYGKGKKTVMHAKLVSTTDR